MERKRNKQPKLHIRKGDIVKVITGDYKKSEKNTGKVLSIDMEKRTAIVEGINIISKHAKPSAANTQGGIVKKEASIHISNLMLIDPSTGKPTRVGRKVEGDKLVRYSKKSGEIIKQVK
jgi:large subunit ribosomal protein L24